MKKNTKNMKNSIPCGTIEVRPKTDIDKLNDLIEESKKISGISIPIENKDIPKTSYEYIGKKLRLVNLTNPISTTSHEIFIKMVREHLTKISLVELNMGENKNKDE